MTVPSELKLYEWMYSSRCMDAIEQRSIESGDAHLHVSCAGHEAIAALALALEPDDYLHLHYRDRALVLARGVSPEQWFNEFLGNPQGPSAGRQISAFYSSRELRLLSPCVPVGNSILQAAGVAEVLKHSAEQGIVLCTLGDGGTQQGSFYEAVMRSTSESLPLLIVVENNDLAISTRTQGKRFFDYCDNDFLGIDVVRVCGWRSKNYMDTATACVRQVRTEQRPIIMVFDTQRLGHHTQSDDQTVYRDESELSQAQERDPLIDLRQTILESAGIDKAQLATLEQDWQRYVEEAYKSALKNSLQPTNVNKSQALSGSEASSEPNSKLYTLDKTDQTYTSCQEAIRSTLAQNLEHNSELLLFGQDIEDPKGDVFGVTRGLSSKFANQVQNAPLSESTIVGSSIGRALTGKTTVAFFQFADFIPNALDHIMQEVASIAWRTHGDWSCPLVFMAPIGGYREGLGPFHSASMESTLAHVPNIHIAIPSNPADAAELLHAAIQSQTPTFFLYPKSLLSKIYSGLQVPSNHDPGNHDGFSIGRAVRLMEGEHVTLISYGNTVSLAQKAASILQKNQYSVDLIDLRWIAPWDKALCLESARKCQHVVIIHEDNRTSGFGSEISAFLAEHLPNIHVKQCCRDDQFLPASHKDHLAALPSVERILESVAEWLGYEVSHQPASEMLETHQIDVIANSISNLDASVELIELAVELGETVSIGQELATVEGMKSTATIESDYQGRVTAIHAAIGQSIDIGKPLLSLSLDKSITLKVEHDDLVLRTLTQSQEATETIEAPASLPDSHISGFLGLKSISVLTGNNQVSSHQLEADLGLQEGFISRRTGIDFRYKADAEQNLQTMAVQVTRQVLEQSQTSVDDLSLLICATSTPDISSPSLACRILSELDQKANHCLALDINAACSGYLYGLQLISDHLYKRQGKSGLALIVTAEVFSDYYSGNADTDILFGDAMTASLLQLTDEAANHGCIGLFKGSYHGRGQDKAQVIKIHSGQGDIDRSIDIDGLATFENAIRYFSLAIDQLNLNQNRGLDDIDWFIPHQANIKIIETLARKMKIPMERFFVNVDQYGNTGASSIPLCLHDMIAEKRHSGKKALLSAFGAGFTFAATEFDFL